MNKVRTEQEVVESLVELKGEKFAQYRKQWGLVNNFELETDFPLFLHIEAIYKCNFKCPMCVLGNESLVEKFGYDERLKTEQIDKILKEGMKYGCPSVSFQGNNEPFLIKEITDWFVLAGNYGYQDIMVNTNGSVMTESLAERIVNSGLTRIRFSLDAINESTYEKIRVGGKFKKVMRNINLLLEKREQLQSPLPKVGVNFVKTSINEHEIEEFKDYWGERVDYVMVQEFMAPDIDPEYEELKGETQKPVTNFKCNQPWQRLYIKGNGEVAPCCAQFNSYLTLGNLDSGTLYDFWNSSEAKELRKLHAEGRYHENPICLKCSKSG